MTDGLAARVERLEIENRRIKRWAAVAVLVAGGAVLLGQAAPERVREVVKARKFHVTDAQGRERAAFCVEPDGTSHVALFDSAGTTRAELAVQADGHPTLDLSDGAGQARIGMSLYPDGHPYLSLQDGSGHGRAGLGFYPSGVTALQLRDVGGNDRVVLQLLADAGPSLVVSDPWGKAIYQAP